MQCANATDVNGQPINRETRDVVVVPYETENKILYYCFTLPQAFDIVNGTGINPLNPSHVFSNQTKANIRMRMDLYNRRKSILTEEKKEEAKEIKENLFPYERYCFGDTAKSVLSRKGLGTYPNDYIVTIIDPITDNREIRIYCFDYTELNRSFRTASRLYEWDVPYNERPNNPVFLLPITTSQGISNIYIDKKTHDTIIIDGFDTVLFTNKRNIRIGSTIGISRLHGALSDVFTGIPVNRNVLENIKKDPTNLNGELIEEESDGGFLDDESDIELLPDSESQPPEVPFIQSITETTVDITDAGRIITELPPHVRTEQFKSWTIRGTNLQTLSVPSTLETLVLIDTLIGDINIPEEHSLKSLTCNNCPNINLPEHLIVSQLKLKDTPLNPEDVILIVEDLSLINSINNLLSVQINNTEILKLDVSNNSNLRSLPNLPDQIEAINISNTSITELPNIPTSLEKIIVSFGFDLQQIEYMMERGIQVTELPLEEWFRE